ncbi:MULTISPECIES: sigma-54 dependent transcriptional regulator [unclassified Beijerinckia]|uniref:sigma-54-dependent transcriptional regulator n=1 Tax=unclassified Beijerinckia TaxID=2638183 RepID=UPI00089C6C80|nr:MULTISPECIES: sigma-54 dependent transcriptional regulator [unclassified Beijerinckia]MDH7798517.1 DNA-binding NtrC family response regulator [Beijerinckia sp. GAS462]SED23529.1 DNA-binding transcriptional response regulator, NtrC family, contains REC, AAA-type ATPase, and a Fis-type DNA-binding domains [Beijerinckia sp. 28-YEA-48]
MSSIILIADDDPVQRRLLEAMVRRFGYEVESVDGGEAALARLEATDKPALSMVILDLVMPDLDGMGVLGKLRERKISTPVIVQTAHGSIEAVISAMRAGAVDFVVKPVGAERLQISIKNALRADALEDEIRRMNRKANGTLGLKDIATRSPEMERIIRLGERAAKSTIPVLIEGESGVGKELIARAIQGASDRRGKAFVTVNCGALPENLVESILFGHEKGAFTGATEKHTGKFLEANGGTLFLDEVGELPLETQVKLLRALQEGEIDPVGGKRSIKVDIRLISATNQNLIELVKRGAFREDLYYRLNVFPISIPPLRSRRDDIPDLARRFTARFAAEEGRKLRGMSSEAVSLLTRYNWPGNVRQLENAVFRAVVLAEGDELTVAEFPQIAAQVDGFDVRIPPAPAAAPLTTQKEIVRIEVRDPNVLRLLDENGNVRRLEDMEAESIRFALAHYRGQMSEMARRLGIGRSTLYRKMKDYGLNDPNEGMETDEVA